MGMLAKRKGTDRSSGFLFHTSVLHAGSSAGLNLGQASARIEESGAIALIFTCLVCSACGGFNRLQES